MAGHVCRSRAGAERHRSLHQQRLRSGDRGRVLSPPSETQPVQAGQGTTPMTKRSSTARSLEWQSSPRKKWRHATGRPNAFASLLEQPGAKFFEENADRHEKRIKVAKKRNGESIFQENC